MQVTAQQRVLPVRMSAFGQALNTLNAHFPSVIPEDCSHPGLPLKGVF